MNNFVIKYHCFVLCLFCYQEGFLANAVVRRVTQPVWPADTVYPLTCLALNTICILSFGIPLLLLKSKNETTTP